MELDRILFPSPKFNSSKISEYDGELVYIPKGNNLYIPCLLLISVSKTISDKYLMFFHGNAEDIFGAREIGERLRYRLNINVIIIEYPTYSLYKQETDTNQILNNGLIVFDYLVNNLKVARSNIYVFGRSIGTSPAIFLSSQRKPGALIAISGFTSIKDAAESLVGKILAAFVSERFTSIDYIKDVTCPILFIHGQKDKLIPFEHSIKLKEACNCPHFFYLPEEMTHNEFDYEEDLLIPIKEFLESNTGIKLPTVGIQKFPNDLYTMPEEIEKLIKTNK